MTPLVLASTSAVRAALLRAAGLSFTTADPQVDEDAVKAGLSAAGPREVAETLARRKALAVSTRRPGMVISADQTLEFEDRLYDKAKNLAEARDRLQMLSGRTHSLHAAVCVAKDGDVLWSHVASPQLTMRHLSETWLHGYLSRHGDSLLASVGGYYLEGEGVQLFESIDGDYFSVLGLPLLSLLAFLRSAGGLDA